jgi:FkbM family methyltransferase
MRRKTFEATFLFRFRALFCILLAVSLFANWKGFVNEKTESVQSTHILQQKSSSFSHGHRKGSDLAVVRRCDEVELQRIKSSPFLKKAHRLNVESRCPKPTWLNDMLDLDYNTISSSHTKRLILSVGCNTALDTVGLALQLSHNPIFNVETWTETMQNTTGRVFTPVCRGATQLSFRSNNPSKFLPIEIHCIEPIDNTVNAIQQTAKLLGLDQHGFHAHQYVVSNSTGVISFPHGDVGVEYLATSLCGKQVMGKMVFCHDVPMVTLDDFARQHLLSDTDDRMVDILTIDTEGFDWRVLRGARSIVSRTRYLEFEYHDAWAEGDLLKDAVDYLEELGFVCYFAGQKRLFKLTNGCWVNEKHEYRVWSNVACVHRSEPAWLDIMEDYYRKTLRIRKPNTSGNPV